MTNHRYFATCAKGIEPILADELRALAASEVQVGRGGVHFAGGSELLYRANLWLRTAVRVLVPILDCDVSSPDELYDAVRSLAWDQYLTPDHTLAVDANVRDSRITHSHYAALRVKDAICDWFVERLGSRPSVDTESPLVGLNLHVHRDRAILSLDSSWESLHKRGYRPILTRAPLNEALGAALILHSRWRGECPFVDPLCGSGTFPIEAAWIALNRPPGLTRRRFGFQGWMDYDVRLWTAIRDQARLGVRKRLDVPIAGSDLRRDAVDFAQANARAAGVGHLVKFDLRDARDARPPDGPPGVLFCNPPYGERLGEESSLVPLYRMLGEAFRRTWQGWTIYVFTASELLASQIDLAPTQVTPWYNGRLQCKLFRYG